MEHKLTHQDYKTIFALAAIFAFRLLGLFMILPVFTPYAQNLQGATSENIGLAFGIYGLTQACLQIPFGMLSDRFGRKPIISLGLVLFGLGSVVAACSHSIDAMIIGRALQGAGAVGSTIIALTADLTREQIRTQAMGLIGLTIGAAFALSLIIGPLIASFTGVTGIFWLTLLLAMLGILILWTAVPSPSTEYQQFSRQTAPKQLWQVLTNKALLRLDLGIMLQHMILTASFVVLPICLTELAGIPSEHHWFLYLPVLLLSVLFMFPCIILAEKYQHMKTVFLVAVTAIFLAQSMLWLHHDSSWLIGIILVLFFAGFNILEACLPSLISKTAPLASKGAAMGVYSTAQFLGIFIGGLSAGWLYSSKQEGQVFLFCAAIAGLWLVISWFMPEPPQWASCLYHLPTSATADPSLQQQIAELPGVCEVYIDPDAHSLMLKVDKKLFSEQSLQTFL